jgi:hypothetical protein
MLPTGGKFDADKNITDTNGVVVTKHISRLSRVEYEHVVPASKFGSTFDEWKAAINRGAWDSFINSFKHCLRMPEAIVRRVAYFIIKYRAVTPCVSSRCYDW